MITPRKPPDPSPEDDPTGVRALLSSLPEPQPMPNYLVERISASLAAEQARRGSPDPGVTALRTAGLPRRRRWGTRLGVVLAGAASVAAIALVGSSLLGRSWNSSGDTASSGAAFSTADSAAPQAEAGRDLGGAPTDSSDSGAVSDGAGALLAIQVSGTRYTAAALTKQARMLLAHPTTFVPFGSASGLSAGSTRAGSPPAPSPSAPSPSGGVTPLNDVTVAAGGIGALGTGEGVWACLKSVGVSLGAGDSAIADHGTYDGSPAVVIVTTQGKAHVAYVVRRDCSATNAALVTALGHP